MDTKLFVGMLSKECSDAEVETMFQPFGTVVECAVLRDSKGNSKGCAFVTFEKYDESNAAISALHGSTRMDGCKANIVVKFADTEKQKQQRYQEHEQGNSSFTEDVSNREDTKLFIGMIGNTITEDKLQSMFSQYGTITECAVLKDSDGNSRGCGFIRFSTVQESVAAIKGMNGTTKLPGANSNVVVKFADNEKQRQQRLQKTTPTRPGAVNPKAMFDLDDTKIFVGMLGTLDSVEELKGMFKPFGDIVDCAILRDSSSGRSKGCGFIRFATPKEAYQAIRVMNGGEKMPGASAKLVVKFADNKKAQQQQQQQPPSMPPPNPYSNQNMNRMGMGDNQNMMPPTGLNNSTINQLLQQQLALTAAAMNLTTGVGGQSSMPNQFSQNQGNPYGGGNQFGQNQPNQFGGGSNNAAPQFGNNTSQFGGSNGQFGNGQSNQYGQGTGASSGQFGGGYKNDYYDEIPSHQGSSGQDAGSGNSLQQVLSQMNSGQQQQQQQQGMSNPASLQQAIAQQQAFIQQALVAQQFNQQPSQPPPPQEPGRPGPDGCNLFVMHLPKECADNQLRQLFTPFGNVLSANIFYDKVTSESKCFGFVSFDDSTCAQNAIKSMNGFQIGGKRLKVQLKTNKKPY